MRQRSWRFSLCVASLLIQPLIVVILRGIIGSSYGTNALSRELVEPLTGLSMLLGGLLGICTAGLATYLLILESRVWIAVTMVLFVALPCILSSTLWLYLSLMVVFSVI